MVSPVSAAGDEAPRPVLRWRAPTEGQRLRLRSGQAKIFRGWQLRKGEWAEVAEAGADGRFRARNPSGEVCPRWFNAKNWEYDEGVPCLPELFTPGEKVEVRDGSDDEWEPGAVYDNGPMRVRLDDYAEDDSGDEFEYVRPRFAVGDNVLCNSMPAGWLPGSIAAANSDGTYDVAREDGKGALPRWPAGAMRHREDVRTNAESATREELEGALMTQPLRKVLAAAGIPPELFDAAPPEAQQRLEELWAQGDASALHAFLGGGGGGDDDDDEDSDASLPACADGDEVPDVQPPDREKPGGGEPGCDKPHGDEGACGEGKAPGGPPGVLLVRCPADSLADSLTGRYELLPDAHNGRPVWGSGQRRVFATARGCWMLTHREDSMAASSGLLCSAAPTHLPPHHVAAWLAKRAGGGWAAAAGVAIAAPEEEEGPRGGGGGGAAAAAALLSNRYADVAAAFKSGGLTAAQALLVDNGVDPVFAERMRNTEVRYGQCNTHAAAAEQQEAAQDP